MVTDRLTGEAYRRGELSELRTAKAELTQRVEDLTIERDGLLKENGKLQAELQGLRAQFQSYMEILNNPMVCLNTSYLDVDVWPEMC